MSAPAGLATHYRPAEWSGPVCAVPAPADREAKTTRFPARVTCRLCRNTHEYRTAVADDGS